MGEDAVMDVVKRQLAAMPCACGEQKQALKVSVIGVPETITRKMTYVDQPIPFFLFPLNLQSFVGSDRVMVTDDEFRYPGEGFGMTRIQAKTRCDLCAHVQTIAVMVSEASA